MEKNIGKEEVINQKYAGFWLRFLAWIIDIIVLWIVGFIVGFVLAIIFPEIADLESDGLFRLLGILITWLYYALMESSNKQATLGKMALELKVTNLEGGSISFAKASGRFFGKILSAIILGVGFLMIAFTQKKQGLHDKLAKCIVIRK